MKIKDKQLKVLVDVAQVGCADFQCYWPRPDPGIFTQGQGYRARDPRSKKPVEWLCGNREIRGCPLHPILKATHKEKG